MRVFATAIGLEQEAAEEQDAQDDGDGDDDDLDETHGLILKVIVASNPGCEGRIVSAWRKPCQRLRS